MEPKDDSVRRHWRVLLIANEGLTDPLLCREACERAGGGMGEALVIAPVVASSALRKLTDDFDDELAVAQSRLDHALVTLWSAGIHAHGRVDVGLPMNCLLDGLREFDAAEVVMLRGGEPGWKDAERFAERVRVELGLPVTEVATRPQPAIAA